MYIIIIDAGMACGEIGVTRIMIHKIPYFRELIIASFNCDHCGESNNDVTFGGEIQVICTTYLSPRAQLLCLYYLHSPWVASTSLNVQTVETSTDRSSSPTAVLC